MEGLELETRAGGLGRQEGWQDMSAASSPNVGPRLAVAEWQSDTPSVLCDQRRCPNP